MRKLVNNPHLDYRSKTLEEGDNPDQNVRVVDCFVTEE